MSLSIGPSTSVDAATAARRDPNVGPHAHQVGTPQAPPGAPGAAPASPPRTADYPRAAKPRREVFGFAPYWELSSAGGWRYDLLTTVAYFGLDVRGDGNFDTSTPGWAGWGSQHLTDLVNRAHQHGARVVVVIKQFDEGTINQIVSNPASSQAAIQNTINAIAVRGLDGVNVDLEGAANPRYPRLADAVTAFMANLSKRVHQTWPAATVTLDTYTGSASWDGGIFKIGDLAPHVDAFFVMAYDMALSNTPGQASPNAPLAGFTYNDTTAVAQYLSKAPAAKIILGVPYYGYKWSTRGDQIYAATAGPSTSASYSGIKDDLACIHQPRVAFDSRSQTPWAAWFSPHRGDPCGGNFNSWRELYYDDAGSLGLKYDLVNGRGLRGAGIWALGYDGSSPELWNLLAAKFS
jgi:spore germination protein YaaH